MVEEAWQLHMTTAPNHAWMYVCTHVALLRWPSLTPRQTRASVNPYLKEAMEFDSYVTFMTDELYEKVEVDIKDYGPTILGLTQQLSSQGNC